MKIAICFSLLQTMKSHKFHKAEFAATERAASMFNNKCQESCSETQ